MATQDKPSPFDTFASMFEASQQGRIVKPITDPRHEQRKGVDGVHVETFCDCGNMDRWDVQVSGHASKITFKVTEQDTFGRWVIEIPAAKRFDWFCKGCRKSGRLQQRTFVVASADVAALGEERIEITPASDFELDDDEGF